MDHCLTVRHSIADTAFDRYARGRAARLDAYVRMQRRRDAESVPGAGREPASRSVPDAERRLDPGKRGGEPDRLAVIAKHQHMCVGEFLKRYAAYRRSDPHRRGDRLDAGRPAGPDDRTVDRFANMA